MPKRNKADHLLSLPTEFKPSTKIPQGLTDEEVLEYLSNNMVLSSPNAEDFEKFGLHKAEYIRTQKKVLTKKLSRIDPIQLILIEKISLIMFELELLNRKFPNSELLIGTTPNANKFVIELESVRTMLTYQLTFLTEAAAFIGEEINEIFIFNRSLKVGKEDTSKKKNDEGIKIQKDNTYKRPPISKNNDKIFRLRELPGGRGFITQQWNC